MTTKGLAFQKQQTLRVWLNTVWLIHVEKLIFLLLKGGGVAGGRLLWTSLSVHMRQSVDKAHFQLSHTMYFQFNQLYVTNFPK